MTIYRNNCYYIKVYYYLRTKFTEIWDCLGVQEVCMIVIMANWCSLTHRYFAVALQSQMWHQNRRSSILNSQHNVIGIHIIY